MACSCKGRSKNLYVWVPEGESSEGPNTKTYTDEIQAKAKVLRNGGQYITVAKAAV